MAEGVAELVRERVDAGLLAEPLAEDLDPPGRERREVVGHWVAAAGEEQLTALGVLRPDAADVAVDLPGEAVLAGVEGDDAVVGALALAHAQVGTVGAADDVVDRDRQARGCGTCFHSGSPAKMRS